MREQLKGALCVATVALTGIVVMWAVWHGYLGP